MPLAKKFGPPVVFKGFVYVQTSYGVVKTRARPIFKHKLGYWAGRTTVDGRRRQWYRKTKQDAWEEFARLRPDLVIEAGEGPRRKASVITVGAALDQWLAENDRRDPRDETKWKRTTRENYGILAGHYLAPLRETPIKQLKADDVRRLLDGLRAKGRSTRTLADIKAVLSIALNFAVRQGYIAKNPIGNREIRLGRARRKSRNPWSEQETKRFLAGCRDLRLGSLYVVALNTGMRQDELLSLTWASVNLDQHELHVPDSKTESGVRTVALDDEAIRVLTALPSKAGLVWPTSKGTPIGSRNLLRDFKLAVKAVGLPEIRFHDLRALAATQMIRKGTPTAVIMKQLGWKTSRMLDEIYARVTTPDQQLAVKGLWD
jgi:integrase